MCLQCFDAVGWKGIRPVETECWGAVMVICLGDVQICIWPICCHCHLLSLAPVKSRFVLVLAHPGNPRLLEGHKMVVCVCVCVCVCTLLKLFLLKPKFII